MILAKYEEREIDIPRPRDLVKLSESTYSDTLCMSMELKILDFFDWKIGLPTVAHFRFASLAVLCR